MSLYHRSSHRYGEPMFDPCRDDEEEHMRIPAVIIVPRRPCRVTSTMAQHYRAMPGAGAEISPSASGRPEGSIKSKPWQVDMARKNYSSSRRFRRTSRRRQPSLPPPPPSAPLLSPMVSCSVPELDGSWNKDDDNGYPSDEENGFGGGCVSSRGSSPASSAHTCGSSFGGIKLRGHYDGPRSGRSSRRNRA